MVATRVIGSFDEKDTCTEKQAIGISLGTSRATWAAAGGGYGDCVPGSRATLLRRIVDDRA